MANAPDIPKEKKSFLTVMAFLIWTAVLMGIFLLNSYEHFHSKLIEFGVM
jgi:hypothetical protein